MVLSASVGWIARFRTLLAALALAMVGPSLWADDASDAFDHGRAALSNADFDKIAQSAQVAAPEFDQAIDAFSVAIRLKPNDARARLYRGYAYAGKGAFDLAITDFTEALRLKPDDSGAYRARGRAWVGKHEYDKGIADYDQAIRLGPKDNFELQDAYEGRAIAHANKGDFDLAVADYGHVGNAYSNNVYTIRSFNESMELGAGVYLCKVVKREHSADSNRTSDGTLC